VGIPPQPSKKGVNYTIFSFRGRKMRFLKILGLVFVISFVVNLLIGGK
jgi:hypothetical protein